MTQLAASNHDLAPPPCDDLDLYFTISLAERQALVRRIMEEGVGAIDEYIREKARGRGEIASQLEQLREALVREARRLKRRLESLAKRKRERVRDRFKERRHALGEREAALDRKLGAWDTIRAGRLELELKNDTVLGEILDFDPSQLPWYKRFWLRLKRFISRLLGLIRRALRWLARKLRSLFSRRYRAQLAREAEEEEQLEKRPFKVVLDNPELAALFERFDLKFDNALFVSDTLKHFIDRELKGPDEVPKAGANGAPRSDRYDGGSAPPRRDERTGDYLTDAQRAMERYLDRKLEKTRRSLKRDRDRLEQQRLEAKKERERLRAEREAAEAELRKREAATRKRVEERLETAAEDEVKRDVLRSLQTAGLIERSGDGDGWALTAHIVDKFAEIILADELEQLRVRKNLKLVGRAQAQGYYRQKRYQTEAESSRMDIVASMLRARMNHPGDPHIYDEDILTATDLRRRAGQVIIAFDRSGSMDEHRRLEAAKRAALALYKIAKSRHRSTYVDFIAFDTKAEHCTLETVWNSTPIGFTNTGEALAIADGLLARHETDEQYLYLITDGLPEAYTSPRDHKRYAGDLDRSMAAAMTAAKQLGKRQQLNTTIVLLEVTDENYIDAAKRLAEPLRARILFTDPAKLAGTLLEDFVTAEKVF